jgi:hypothetical protein
MDKDFYEKVINVYSEIEKLSNTATVPMGVFSLTPFKQMLIDFKLLQTTLEDIVAQENNKTYNPIKRIIKCLHELRTREPGRN